MKSQKLLMPLIGVVTIAIIIVSLALPRPEDNNIDVEDFNLVDEEEFAEEDSEEQQPSSKTNSNETKAISFISADSDYDSYYDEMDIHIRLKSTGKFQTDTLKFTVVDGVKCSLRDLGGGHLRLTGNFDFSKVYTFKIAKGLKSTSNEILKEDLVIKVQTCDRDPQLRFLSRGLYYPLNSKRLELPFSVVNYKKVKAELYHSFDNNLFFDFDSSRYTAIDARYRMEKIGEKEINVEAAKNQSVNHMLNFEELFQNRKKQAGVYVLSLRPEELLDGSECYHSPVYNVMMLTDFAVNLVSDVVNDSGIALYTHRLSTGEPLADADVVIYSCKNQVAATGKTDSDGLAKLVYDPAWKREDDSVSVVKIMTDKEFMFCPFDFYDYEAEYADSVNRPSAFVFTERGACRPGETFTVSSFIRKWEKGRYLPLKNAPVTLTVRNPSNQIVTKTVLKTDAYGFVSKDIALSQNAMTGSYDCTFGLDTQTWGTTDIYISNYTPDRMKIKMGHKEKADGVFTFKDGIDFNADVNYYFGPKATGINASFSAWAKRAPFPKHWDGWSVGCEDEDYLNTEKARKSFASADSPFVYTAPSLLTLKCCSTVPVCYGCSFSANEPGGRAVTDTDAVTVYPMRHYIGLKTQSENSELAITCGLLGIDPAKKESLDSDKEIEVTFQSVDWDYVLENDGGSYRKVWRKITKDLSALTFKVAIPKDAEPDVWKITKNISLSSGHYIVKAQQLDNPESGITETEVWHYNGETGKRSADPQRLTFKTDSDTYQPGSTAKLTFRYDAPARAFYVCGSQFIDDQQTADIKPGENVISVKIPDDCTTGSYYTQVIIIGKNGEDYTRSIGLAELKVSQEQAHKLTLKVDAPETAQPGDKINVTLTSADAAGKPVGGEALLFAVDSGVLSLTDYQTPDIFKFFYGRRNSVFGSFEMYGDLYPQLKLMPDGTIAGDKSINKLKNTSLKKKATARLVIPPFIMPDDGKFTVPVQLPDHTGAMRFMAVMSNENMTGSGDFELKMRNPLSISLTAPGAVAVGDEFQVSVRVFNNNAADVAGKLVLSCPGTSEPETVITVDALAPDSHKDFSFRKTASQNGTFTVNAKFTLGSAETSESDYLTVRPVFVPQTVIKSYVIQPNASADITIPNGFECKDASISVAASPAVYLRDVLSWLNDYPYGCVEQITSKAFPFIALADMRKIGLIDDAQVTLYKNRVPDTYSSLLGMLRYNGAFSMWSSGSDAWREGSVYAAHFILAAKRAKLIDPEKAILDKILKYQRIQANDASLDRTLRAYSAYVLSLAGDKGAVTPARNILVSSIVASEKGFADFLAGAALVQSGYASEGASAIANGLKGDIANAKSLDALSGFSSYPAKLGMELAILSELGINDDDAQKQQLEIAFELVKQLNKDNTGWGTTQANAWGCFGLTAYAKLMSAGIEPCRATVTYGNGKSEVIDAEQKKFVPQDRKITIQNNGNAPMFVQLTRTGTPEDGDPDADALIRQQIHLSREYLNEQGEPITSIKSGDLLYVRLRAAVDCDVEHLVIADMIPGGFEIEDEQLATRQSKDLPAAIKKEFNQFCDMNIQKGDDKFVVYVRKVYKDEKQDIIYKLRAVTPGKFRIPQAEAEGMYRPDIKGLIPVAPDGTSAFFTIE